MIPFLPTINAPLPKTGVAKRNALGRFLFTGSPLDVPNRGEHKHPWYLVLWLTGVDYFSTLGYAPGIAMAAAGVLCLPATGVLVLVTIFGAVPIYAEVAARSYAGQGSIALLENLFSGWKSKIFVLVLLGFAGTDFVITMTLSAADARSLISHIRSLVISLAAFTTFRRSLCFGWQGHQQWLDC